MWDIPLLCVTEVCVVTPVIQYEVNSHCNPLMKHMEEDRVIQWSQRSPVRVYTVHRIEAQPQTTLFICMKGPGPLDYTYIQC